MGDRAGGSGPGFYLSVHLDSKRTTEHQTAMDPKQSNRVNCRASHWDMGPVSDSKEAGHRPSRDLHKHGVGA
jgi:hypothetical protein